MKLARIQSLCNFLSFKATKVWVLTMVWILACIIKAVQQRPLGGTQPGIMKVQWNIYTKCYLYCPRHNQVLALPIWTLPEWQKFPPPFKRKSPWNAFLFVCWWKKQSFKDHLSKLGLIFNMLKSAYRWWGNSWFQVQMIKLKEEWGFFSNYLEKYV